MKYSRALMCACGRTLPALRQKDPLKMQRYLMHLIMPGHPYKQGGIY